MPTSRLAFAFLVCAVIAAVGAPWSLPYGGVAAAVLVTIVAAFDALALRKQPTPSVDRPQELTGSLRRPVTLTVAVGPSRALAEVTVDWPRDAGGPTPVARTERNASRGDDATAGSSTLTFQAVPQRRGRHTIGALWLRLVSPLGLWTTRRYAREETDLFVYPDLKGPADDVLGRETEDEGEHGTLGLPESGTELRGLRPFQSGDDPRHVDWKATARHGSPVVREWDPDRHRSVLVALDAGRLMRAVHDGESKFDAALRALGRVTMAAEARGDSVGLVVYSDAVRRVVPPLTGAGQARRLLRFVSDLEPDSHDSDPVPVVAQLLAERRRALVVVITDVVDRASATDLQAGVAQLATRHLPVVALLRDPQLDQTLAAPVEQASEAYLRAAAEHVTRERSAAVERLRARGVRAFDVSMGALALDVVQTYLDVRRQGRW
jgi:uncharacterized protein (DUF58 family)